MGGMWAQRMLLYAQHVWFTIPGVADVGPAYLMDGLRFSIPLLLFLTVHEFGHYFAARHHRVSATLPFFIPVPFGIGTMGAVIAIREALPSTRKLFDVGAAGPLAGFVVALGALVWGLATLPGLDYLQAMPGHEWILDYIARHGAYPAHAPAGTDPLRVGPTLLFTFLARLFPNVPPTFELYHFPVLFAGWMGLFFTALNLLPVGQLDGGHVVYSLFGPRLHARIARATVLLLMLSGGVGTAAYFVPIFDGLYWGGAWVVWLALAALYVFLLRAMFGPSPRRVAPLLAGLLGLVALAVWVGPALTRYSYGFWLVWAFLLVRFIRVDHPPVLHPQPLTPARRVLGYVCLALLVLCFSPTPLQGG